MAQACTEIQAGRGARFRKNFIAGMKVKERLSCIDFVKNFLSHAKNLFSPSLQPPEKSKQSCRKVDKRAQKRGKLKKDLKGTLISRLKV